VIVFLKGMDNRHLRIKVLKFSSFGSFPTSKCH